MKEKNLTQIKVIERSRKGINDGIKISHRSKYQKDQERGMNERIKISHRSMC